MYLGGPYYLSVYLSLCVFTVETTYMADHFLVHSDSLLYMT